MSQHLYSSQSQIDWNTSRLYNTKLPTEVSFSRVQPFAYDSQHDIPTHNRMLLTPRKATYSALIETTMQPDFIRTTNNQSFITYSSLHSPMTPTPFLLPYFLLSLHRQSAVLSYLRTRLLLITHWQTTDNASTYFSDVTLRSPSNSLHTGDEYSEISRRVSKTSLPQLLAIVPPPRYMTPSPGNNDARTQLLGQGLTTSNRM